MHLMVNNKLRTTMLISQVEAALRQAEIVRWLSSNRAQQSEASGRDPSALLHRLRLGQATAPSSAKQQVGQGFKSSDCLISAESLESITLPVDHCVVQCSHLAHCRVSTSCQFDALQHVGAA